MKKTKRSLKKYLAILLAALLAISSMWCFTAFAAGDVLYIDENGAQQTLTEDYTPTSDLSSTHSWGTAGTTTWIVLDNDYSYTSARTNIYGDVNLILTDGCTLTAASVYVDDGNSLTIYAQSEGSGAGALTSTAGSTNRAGIGGNASKSGEITINGGNITATGANSGAGIGSGGSGNEAGAITINGGNITATGGQNAAGIGGGTIGGYSTITINGGTVNAYGDNRTGSAGTTNRAGSGIGGGYGGTAGEITINGGTVTAEGAYTGAGIGSCGRSGDDYTTENGTVTINGGVINATGGSTSAGIGDGAFATGGEVIINGGVIDATGGNNVISTNSGGGSGIGCGSNGTGAAVTINSGYVYALGRNGGAGIGGGYNGNGGNITISGGTVIAEKTEANTTCYGIGNGENYTGGTTFSTGEEGHAVIYTSSITDETGMESWSGVISKDDIDGPALVYGTPVITDEEQIPSGKTAWIEDEKVLEIAQGFTLTNNGTVYQNYTSTFNKYVEGDASMENYGTYEEYGTTWYEVRKADSKKDITVTGKTTEYESGLYSNAAEVLTVSDATDLMVKTYKDKSIAVTNQTFTMPLEPVLLTDVLADSVTIEKIWKDVGGAVITGTATASCPNVSMGLFAQSDAEDNIKEENGEYYYISSEGDEYKIDSDYYARDDEGNIVAYYDYTQGDAALYVIVSVLDTYATVFQNPVALSYDAQDTENYGWVYTWNLLDSELSYVVMELTEDEGFEAGTPAVTNSETSDSGTKYTWQVENQLTTEITAKENPVNIYVYDGTEIESPEGAPLSGAGFILSRVETVEGEEVTYYAYCEKDEDGCWAVAGWIPEGSENAEYATILTSGDDGYIRFSNIDSIDSGEYRLTEVTAPAGYLLPTESIGFTVDASGAVQSGDVEIYEDGITIPVANVGGSEMPLTGGTGTIMYTMVGLLLIICAVYLLYRKKRTEGGIRQRE